MLCLVINSIVWLKKNVRDTEIPAQACRDPEVSRRLRLPGFMTVGT
jgi:hypothetical protein